LNYTLGTISDGPLWAIGDGKHDHCAANPSKERRDLVALEQINFDRIHLMHNLASTHFCQARWEVWHDGCDQGSLQRRHHHKRHAHTSITVTL